MEKRGAALILLLILCFSLISSSEMLLVKSKSNSLVTVNDEHFIIQEVLGGFRARFFVGSFNATNGYWIELDLSSSSNDAYLVYLDVLSANHGTIFSAKGKNFSQTIYLNYEDIYNITIAKSPFYSDVQINGVIDVFHQDETEQSSSGNWSEVIRFTYDKGTMFTTDPFTIDYVEWRIRWEYEPQPEVPEEHPSLHVCVYAQESPGSWFESIRKRGTEETNGTLYIHDKNGTFYLLIISAVQSYKLIIEQNLESIPEFPSWIILPLFLIATLIVIVMRKNIGLPKKGLTKE